jgi:peptidoglycan/xylan/chitin deacetylase (PgdA/CDA1 family)
MNIFLGPKKVIHSLRRAASLPSTALRYGYFIFVRSRPEPGVIRHGVSYKRQIALTFDDGPTSNFTSAILDILKAYNVKATFFLVGKFAKRHHELCRRILNEGHEIGNHTYSHRNMLSKMPFQIKREIESAEQAIVEASGVKPKYFRPPMGMYNRFVKRIALEQGYSMVLWNIKTFDSSINIRGHRHIISKIQRLAKPGDIILLHDSKNRIKNVMDRKATLKALPKIIDALLSMGLKPVTLSELLKESEGIGGSKHELYASFS